MLVIEMKNKTNLMSTDWLGILVVLMMFGLVLALGVSIYFWWMRYQLVEKNKGLQDDFTKKVDELIEKKKSSEKTSH